MRVIFWAPRASRISNRHLADSRQHFAVQDSQLLVKFFTLSLLAVSLSNQSRSRQHSCPRALV